MKVIRYLLDNGARGNFGRPNGLSPFYQASKNGHDEVVNILTQCGAARAKAQHNAIVFYWKRGLKSHACMACLGVAWSGLTKAVPGSGTWLCLGKRQECFGAGNFGR